MFKTLKLLFNQKNKDIRIRVLFTLACLFVFIVGKTIMLYDLWRPVIGSRAVKIYSPGSKLMFNLAIPLESVIRL